MTVCYDNYENTILTITLMLGRNLVFKSIFNLSNFSRMSQTNYSIDIGGMRTKYKNKEEVFLEDKLDCKEPFGQFQAWYDEACATPEILEPRAMCLATSTRSGIPSARYVILRSHGLDGFKFFTSYRSRKGIELTENPNAALVFYWECLKRSIRIEGIVEKLSEEESTQFFHSRPKAYQIEAAFSEQSQLISNRSELSLKESKLKELYENCDSIPKPNEWGGFILKPHSIEFWQGQSDRLHDRIRFRILKENEVVDNNLLHQGVNGWVYERLQP